MMPEGAGERMIAALQESELRDLDLANKEKQKMELSPIAQRVKDLMRQRGISARELSRRIGMSPSYINTLTRGKTAVPSTPVILMLSSVLEEDLGPYAVASVEWEQDRLRQAIENEPNERLIRANERISRANERITDARVTHPLPTGAASASQSGPGSISLGAIENKTNVAYRTLPRLPYVNHDTRALTVAGVVEAGTWRPRDEYGDVQDAVVDLIRDPRFPSARQEAHLVRGDSMNAAGIYHGGYVRVISIADVPMSLRPGMIVVVERARDAGQLVERTLKEVQISETKGFKLVPRSTFDRYQAIEVASTADLLDETAEVRVLGFVTAFIHPIQF